MKLIRWYKPESHYGQTALDDAFGRFFGTGALGGLTGQAWSPAIDVHEDANNLVVIAELPGLKKEEIEVSLHDGVLTLSGERKVEKVEGRHAHLVERFVGKFKRSLALPSEVAADKVMAAYEGGILTVTLPKVEAAKPRKIALN